MAKARRARWPVDPTLWRAAPRVFLHKRLQRLAVTITERLLNLVSPLHIVVAATGAPWADSPGPETLLARFRHVECPASLRVGASAPFRVRVQNTGRARWIAHADGSGVGQVRRGLSLPDSEGRLRQLDFGRYGLARDVAPGEEVRIEGQVPPLAAAGRYVLRFDLVAEGVSWFADRGTIPYAVPIEVAP